MHFHLPKPLHGWREFTGEVGIIVLGVLIALGAEQAIDTLHSRAEVKQTRQALDVELGHNFASLDYRLGIQSCAQERLNELQEIIDRDSRGERVPLKHDFSPPIIMALRSAIWDAASGDAKSRMSLKVKLQYAMLYDIFHNYEKFEAADLGNWNQLADLDFDRGLTPEETRNAMIAIKRLRRRDALLPQYSSLLQLYASPLHVGPVDDLDEGTSRVMHEDRAKFCSHLI
jgi:hypothetical protein